MSQPQRKKGNKTEDAAAALIKSRAELNVRIFYPDIMTNSPDMIDFIGWAVTPGYKSQEGLSPDTADTV
jgi:hypothetical protein